MYFSDFTYNKSKSKTIILIHGAYGTAGYWLPYLKLFDNFKIIVLNMDYSAILNTSKDLNLTKKLLNKYVNEQNLIAVISHSLGTIFSNFLTSQNQSLNFNLCPMVYSKRINIEKFGTELHSKLGPKNLKIKTDSNLTFKLIEQSKTYNSERTYYFVPLLDNFFIYDFPLEAKKIDFEGDHFEIKNALNLIIKKLSI